MKVIKLDEATREELSAIANRDDATYVEERVKQLKYIHPSYPLPSYPPPVFESGFMKQVCRDAVSLTSLIKQIPHRIFRGDFAAWARALGYSGQMAKTLASYCSSRTIEVATAFARPDVLITDDGYQFLEFNISPYIAGLGTYERLASLYIESPYLKATASLGYNCEVGNVDQAWRETVKNLTRFHDDVKRPVFYLAVAEPDYEASFDWVRKDISALAESIGYEVVVGPMRTLTVSPTGVCRQDGQRVHVVFTCMTYHEMLNNNIPTALLEQLVHADADRIVDLLVPPNNTLFENKLNLAILHDPEMRGALSYEERSLIDKHIPHTCILNQNTMKEAAKYRERYVLKPSVGQRASGVHIGARLDDHEWHEKLDAALRSDEYYLLQHCVANVYRYNDDSAGIANICLGPIITGDQCHGAMVRVQPFDGRVNIMNSSAFGCRLAVSLTAH